MQNIFCVITLFTGILLRISAKRVMLYDTTKESMLRWTTYSPARSEDGWLEESYTQVQDGANWRSYVVCDVEKRQVNNWLRMPYIERGDAERISMEVTFTIRDCQKFPRAARTCKETFSLLAYEADIDFANRDQPPWTDTGPNSYKRIDRLTALAGGFVDHKNTAVSVEVRHVPVVKKGVYFAFRDEGACISILAVKIYYEVCEEVIISHALFPVTAVGPNLTVIKEVRGHCVQNASAPAAYTGPKYYCKGDGTWALLTGGCQCNPGYKPDGSRCLACELDFYKDTPGIASCLPCPMNSATKRIGSAWCDCKDGYYRSPFDSKSSPCESIPSAPRGMKVISTSPTEVTITWSPPEDLGNRPGLWYRVECPRCPPDTIYSPSKSRFLASNVTLTNLESAITYTVYLYVENDLTVQLGRRVSPSYAILNVTTSWPSKGTLVRGIRLESSTDNELTFSWEPPSHFEPAFGVALEEAWPTTFSPEHRRNMVKYYMVRLRIKDDTKDGTLISPSVYSSGASMVNNETVSTTLTTFTCTDLDPDTEYGLDVRANTIYGWSVWSVICWARTNRSQDQEVIVRTPEDDDDVVHTPGAISGIFAACSVVAGIGIWIAYLVWRRNRGSCCKRQKPASDLDVFDFTKGPHTILQCHQNSSGRFQTVSCGTLPPESVSSQLPPQQADQLGTLVGSKCYVDPLTYEDPNCELKAIEIDPNDIVIEEVIGEGEFGKVCKGKYFSPGQFNIAETVAIKTLKPGSSDKAKSDFLIEASIMDQFKHQNVIQLKGVVTKKEPVMIITEYVENGALNRFLQKNKETTNLRQLVMMLRGVASGMAYLSDMGFVHRDLAARNILVDSCLSCKIADFGLSRTLVDGSVEQVYVTQGGIIPVRWTAPEAVTHRKFTSASDVWSFGVVMWEVMSYGKRPYGQWTNQEVVAAIEKGYRLQNPEGCPLELYDLMLECWQENRHDRPSFPNIFGMLDRFLQRLGNVESSDGFSPTSGNGGSLVSLHSSSAIRPSSSIITCRAAASTGSSSGFVSMQRLNATVQPVTPSFPNCTLPTTSIDHILSGYPLDLFLRRLNLDQHLPVFHQKNRYTVSDLSRLTIIDLASDGIPISHGNRMLSAVDELRRYPYVALDATLPRRAGGPHERPPKGPPPPPPPLSASSMSSLNGRSLRNTKEGYFV